MYYYSYGYEIRDTNSYTDTNYRDGGYMAIKKYWRPINYLPPHLAVSIIIRTFVLW